MINLLNSNFHFSSRNNICDETRDIGSFWEGTQFTFEQETSLGWTRITDSDWKKRDKENWQKEKKREKIRENSEKVTCTKSQKWNKKRLNATLLLKYLKVS